MRTVVFLSLFLLLLHPPLPVLPADPPPPPRPSTAACTHYASPSGGGKGASPSRPMTLAQFVARARPGQTLCLADGTYGRIHIGEDVRGTQSQPITIRALNDGKVTIDAGKMFQTCGSATLSESERTSNASEGSDDHPSVTLPLLPTDRYC
jgi:chondroitinase B-like protein